MIVGFCNPLIDATVHVDAQYLEKWKLKNDNAILANEEYQPLIDEVVNNPEVYLTSGGAIQNTLVMAQWAIQKEGATTMVGAVGNDPNREKLETVINNSGVNTLYQVIEQQFTGVSAILICENNRSIVASVAASSKFDFTRWDTPEVLEAVHNAKVVLTSGFFIQSSDRTCLALASECLQYNVPLAFGVSAPFCLQNELAWPTIRQILRMATIVFMNSIEAITLGQIWELLPADATEQNVDIKKLVKDLAEFGNLNHKRTFVITCGSLPTVACVSGEEPISRPVIPIKTEEIVDTNGAGDSFAGGFLAGYALGKDIAKCIDIGAYVAYNNLRNRGCTVPENTPDQSIF